MRSNKKKLKKLILFILSNYNNSKLTETKLQKLLYYCDFNYYEKYESSITGFYYHKNFYGPTIKILPMVLKELEEAGDIKRVVGSNFFGTPKTNYSVLTPGNELIETFSDSETLVIKQVNSDYEGLTAREISSLSHRDPPYVIATDQKKLDYEDVIYREDLLEEDTPDEDAEKYFDSIKIDRLLSGKQSDTQNGTD